MRLSLWEVTLFSALLWLGSALRSALRSAQPAEYGTRAVLVQTYCGSTDVKRAIAFLAVSISQQLWLWLSSLRKQLARGRGCSG